MIEVEGPDGAIVEFPDDMPHDAIKSVMAKHYGGGATPQTPEGFAPRSVREADPSREQMKGAYEEIARGERDRQGPIEQFARTVGRGLSRAIPFADDLSAGMNTLGGMAGTMPERSFQENLDRQRGYNRADEQDRPVEAYGSQLAGGLALPVPAAGIAKGALAGAGYGAAYGLGSGDDLKDRLGKAATGAAIGAPLGAIGGGLAARSERKALAANPATRDLLNGPPKAGEAVKQTLTRDELQQQAAKGYERAFNSDVYVKPASMQRLVKDINGDLAEFGFSPSLAPKAAGFLKEIGQRVEPGLPHTLKDLDLLRRSAQQLGASTEAAEREIGRQIVKKIDKHLDNLGAADVLPGGNVTEGLTALKEARNLWKINKKSEIVQEALEKAERQAAKAGTGGNIDNATRQQVDRILNSPKLRRAFSREEQAAMKAIVKGYKGQNLTRLISRLSPEGNGLSLLLHIMGGSATGGATVPFAVGGAVAKRISDKITPNRVRALDEAIRTVER
jgi:hypothetical protein